MNTMELKNMLIQRISEIDDNTFLNAIKTILDLKENKQILELTAEQYDEIMLSKREVEQGNFVGNVDLDKEVTRWLEEK